MVQSKFDIIYRFVRVLVPLSIITILGIMSVCAQSNGGKIDVKIYFPYDESYIDASYMDNQRILSTVDSILKDSLYISTLSRIEVCAQSSPEGSVDYNTQLSERRIATLEEYFTTNYPQIEPSMWLFKSVAENWELFIEHLEEDVNIPSRDKVLAIAYGDRELDEKEWLLKTLDDGRPWQYIKEHILPTQRFGASILFIPMIPVKGLEHIVSNLDLPTLPITLIQPTVAEDAESKFLFAIKTNLLLDALSVVNIGVEIPIGRRWSVVGEVAHPWWRSWNADFTMQVEAYHGELKYWLGDRDAKEHLQGWYVGAYGGWERYDIQPFTSKGVQGTCVDFGLELGYAHPIARNLHLEYTISAGYTSASYQDYYMVDDSDEYGDIKVIPYPWVQNSLKAVLPTRCGVSLVWTIKSRGER